MDNPGTKSPLPSEPSPLTPDEAVSTGAFLVQKMIAGSMVSALDQANDFHEQTLAEERAKHAAEMAEQQAEHETAMAAQQAEHALRERETEERMAILKDEKRRDALTGLLNRQSIVDSYAGLQQYGHRLSPGRHNKVLFLDLDRFKELNDSQGHNAGDEMLKHVARTLENNARKGDLAFRLGGDEFIVLLIDITNERAMDYAEAVRQEIADTGKVTASIGVADAKTDGSFEDFKAEADTAMYQAKAAGRDTIVEFESGRPRN